MIKQFKHLWRVASYLSTLSYPVLVSGFKDQHLKSVQKQNFPCITSWNILTELDARILTSELFLFLFVSTLICSYYIHLIVMTLWKLFGLWKSSQNLLLDWINDVMTRPSIFAYCIVSFFFFHELTSLESVCLRLHRC